MRYHIRDGLLRSSLVVLTNNFIEIPQQAERQNSMTNESDNAKEQFLNPTSKFYGKFTPQNLTFNANLQEFANQVSFVCGLETNGKISAEEAYNRIKEMWQDLKASKKNLLDNRDFKPEKDK